MRERTDLDKKPTWYLFLTANIVVFLGTIITFVLFKNGEVEDNIKIWLPTLICNIVSLVIAALFVWLEARGVMNKIAHFRRKWLYWYLTALIIFVAAIIFSFVFFVLYRSGYFQNKGNLDWKILIGDVAGTGLLTLLSIAFQRYARYKIDLDIYKRNHGELPTDENKNKEKADGKKPDTDNKTAATSGLSNQIEQ